MNLAGTPENEARRRRGGAVPTRSPEEATAAPAETVTGKCGAEELFQGSERGTPQGWSIKCTLITKHMGNI